MKARQKPCYALRTMLENSFIHLPGVGPETEQKLWSLGLLNWDQLESQISTVFSGKKAAKIQASLEQSRLAQQSGEFHFFQGRLKGSEMWRLVPALLNPQFDSKIAYLDIETTGLGFPPQSHSTTIAVLFDHQLFVEHEHQKKLDLLRRIDAEAKLLVTFNGGPFDLPFLRREFSLDLQQAHLDLRFWFANLGFRGGLKKIQQAFAEVPQRSSMDIDGFDAVRLWNLHLRGIPRALETLATYNAEDTLVLEHLLICGLNLESQKRTSLKLATYERPKQREIPTRVCPEVYRLLRGS